ncbi:tRNA dihydrouridine synthase [Leadbettera azotonutricia]|nr:tRNA-dihydrouridine synthase family protein [Leadbettera azotonutricia]
MAKSYPRQELSAVFALSFFVYNFDNDTMSAPYMLAPMAELSHRPLRELIETFSGPGLSGCSEYFTEMISAGAFIAGGPFESWYADNGPCPRKIVYQIVGSDPSHLARAASLLDQNECLGIDINMGCSAPAIARTGAGVRWMADIGKAGEMIALARKGVKRRLSVKLRLSTGYALPEGEDEFVYLVRFCRRLEEAGVELITLHPRTGREKFHRTARWDYVSALRKELRIPVAGNGDIADAAGFLARASSGVCDAVMVGRAAVKQPWIFAQARQMEAAGLGAAPLGTGESVAQSGEVFTKMNINIEETGLLFLDLLAKYQPPEFHLSRAQRFFGYFCDNLKWGNYVKTLLNRETELSGIGRAWSGYFREGEE